MGPYLPYPSDAEGKYCIFQFKFFTTTYCDLQISHLNTMQLFIGKNIRTQVTAYNKVHMSKSTKEITKGISYSFFHLHTVPGY